jgi:catechol 2,3-dioxygenase-like lactoylglutathione lyase family enzyme
VVCAQDTGQQRDDEAIQTRYTPDQLKKDDTAIMNLGKFSVSLAVSDLDESRGFYQKLGFRVHGGDGENHVMMSNGDTLIGLFQGMFEDNILTFNTADVRATQAELKTAGVVFMTEADEGQGMAHAVLHDPDGNVILLDQF